jgi:hypothetical protein
VRLRADGILRPSDPARRRIHSEGDVVARSTSRPPSSS